MSQTRPGSEQLRFHSSATGTHILDDYLEEVELGGRRLSDLLSDVFDPATGLIEALQFAFDDSSPIPTLSIRYRREQSYTTISAFTDAFTAIQDSVDIASGHANTALSHANTALSHANTALSHANTALSHANTALSHANTASGHADAASSSASDAADSANFAEGRFDAFRGLYFGPLSSEPTQDPWGDPLVDGQFYTDTATNRLRIYLDGAWTDAAIDANGALMAAQNLADIPDLAAARANLGVNPVSFTKITSSQTWNKPSTGTFVRVRLWGAGGGGMSGRADTAVNDDSEGGPGGGGGQYVEQMFLLSDLPASVLVTIGAGGAGAPADPDPETNDVEAGDGGDTTFGDLMVAMGGGAASPRQFEGRGGGPSSEGGVGGSGGAGGWGSRNAGRAADPTDGGGGGGGGGGGHTSYPYPGGAGGVPLGLDDSEGANDPTTTPGAAGAAGSRFGEGGAGGHASLTGPGGAGGAGAPGGGGGGGGASVSPNLPGAGGPGGRGHAEIIVW